MVFTVILHLFLIVYDVFLQFMKNYIDLLIILLYNYCVLTIFSIDSIKRKDTENVKQSYQKHLRSYT